MPAQPSPLTALFADLARGDLEAATARFHSDAVVQEVMLAPSPASAALAERYAGPMATEVRAWAVAGDRAFVERIERPSSSAGDEGLRCAAAVRVEGGRIRWLRDYYDRADLAAARQRAGIPLDRSNDRVAQPPVRLVGLDSPPPSAEAEAADATVRAFFADWSALDPVRLAAWWTPEGIYDNAPASGEPVRCGRDEIAALWTRWAAFMDGVDVEIVGMAADGDRVFVERLDHVHFKGREMVKTLPCLGVLEVADGQISAFRDYFDQGWFADFS